MRSEIVGPETGPILPMVRDVSTEAKVSFLASGRAFLPADRPVTVVETHTSWLFIGRTRVLKLKKPVRFPFLDLTTPERRRRNCDTELRLNRRLAPNIYRRVIGLYCTPRGTLTINRNGGTVIDWLVEMQRLPANRMLDHLIEHQQLRRPDVEALALHLARFYAAEKPQRRDGDAYLRHLRIESAVNRSILMDRRLGMANGRIEHLLNTFDTLLDRWTPAIEARIAAGLIVDGHGDLRPGHICLTSPPLIYDCLEFDRNMRLLDPYDEVTFLGMECAMLGAAWVRPLLLRGLRTLLGNAPDRRLIATYATFRALLRARLCLAHLLDAEPREPERWLRRTRRYLGVAVREELKASG